MASQNSIIKNYNWNTATTSGIIQKLININDDKYQYLKNELMGKIFPVMRSEDKILLLDGLTLVINLIYIKFGFIGNESLFWDQLIQNNLLDLKALLLMMLPFIDDNEKDDNKHKLKKLENLYLEVDKNGSFVYTNAQYNRCIRQKIKDRIIKFDRPYIKDYFVHHLELLLMSIESVSNKLYVNWIDVLPVKMKNFVDSKLYKDTIKKFVGKIVTNDDGVQTAVRDEKINNVGLINNYIDPNPGISYQDFYNVMSNHLYHQIKNYKWLIYDIIVQNKPIPYVVYLETKLNLKNIWDGIMWSQFDKGEADIFRYKWINFLNSIDPNDNVILCHIYIFFTDHYRGARRLVLQKKFIPYTKERDEESDENQPITAEMINNAKNAFSNVPVEEIYFFLYDQLSMFKRSWYYYTIKIKKTLHLAEDKNLFITPKNIYNYCKSMVHYSPIFPEFVQLPQYWHSLKPKFIEMVMVRMLDVEHPVYNDWKKYNWFNINRYIKKIYPNAKENLYEINFYIHSMIRTKLVGIVFESLIYHGLLSEFRPNGDVTNSLLMGTSAKEKLKQQYFTGLNRQDYENNSYYFLTGNTYGELDTIKSKDYPNYEMKYFDFLINDQTWTFAYAMNWASQINFYHHYLNTRIMYITGATGVGKSTHVPKLLMYSQTMLDFNLFGKIICTQPRIQPTVDNAETISKQLGVPIRAYNKLFDKNIFTDNYYVQYKHQYEEHVDEKSNSFLRIVTDGTLFDEIKRYPFLTESNADPYAVDYNNAPIKWVQTFKAKNIYDIIIVDEAHEHNSNMDMILTLARDSVYINNSVKLVIVSATMKDDEPIYRRYYRTINDNRLYPLSAFIEGQKLDRANMDRRMHISPPGATTQFPIKDVYLPKPESDLINDSNFVEYGIKKTIEIANSTTSGDILLFLTGKEDIKKAVKKINAAIPSNMITFGYYSELSGEKKEFIRTIHQTLKTYTRFREDIDLEEKDVTRNLPEGTYTRAIIIATNVAEASITLQNLRYVIDTGYAKVNVYDPIMGVSKLITLPISQSSSTQRRGRVGRVAPGEVYYLYAKEKIENNQTAYKIADSDIKDIVVKLLKSDPADSFIIDKMNDINNISVLKSIPNLEKKESGIFDIFKNPRCYLDIIKKQYMYMPHTSDISQYYSYYGKTDGMNYDEVTLKANLSDYMQRNHDDYHYQQELEFWSRGFTGYSTKILRDNDLTFYIIHPDENVINRNLFTGQIISLKNSPSVSSSYYYYLMVANHITSIDKFDYKNFNFLKYNLAIDDARIQLLVIDVPTKEVDPTIYYSNITNENIKMNIKYYYDLIFYIFANQEITTIRSQILSNLDSIQSITSLTILDNTSNLLWYAYSIPYGRQEDVLALIILMDTISDITDLAQDTQSKNSVQKFFMLHRSTKGDIYSLWRIWEHIKEILQKNNLFSLTNIDINFISKFKNYKEQFLFYRKNPKNIKPSYLPYEEFKTFDIMYKSGKLNTQDEFYNYLSVLTIDFKDIIKKSKISDYINIVSKDNMLNRTKIEEFVIEYFNSLFQVNKKIWMYEYKIANNIDNLTKTDDVMKWANEKLSLPGISYPYKKIDIWDYILETYLRAFSINLMKCEKNYYLRINKAVRMDPKYWSQKIKLERTFLNNKTEYIVYHNYEAREDKITATYLTPVKLEWILELNPIYYYYLFFDKNNILYLFQEDEDVNHIIDIINSKKHLFDLKSLVAYLDRIDNPIISKMVRNKVIKNIE
ncbi:MAG: putative ATP-dependent RNA helicase [Satyrvirus sp.]|uniref:RNA helicase n=1 Tax=Satyrvirus sp. TaxID=2487771 RepID=A0A3G5AE43_9VIRU|nr:MAG: putative ATP-dependent RNA helicase [Satyrvirus sp.]